MDDCKSISSRKFCQSLSFQGLGINNTTHFLGIGSPGGIPATWIYVGTYLISIYLNQFIRVGMIEEYPPKGLSSPKIGCEGGLADRQPALEYDHEKIRL